jgi:flagellar basal body rod protein FlgG
MDGTQWAASAMIAARTRLDIAANNLANVSTDGFARVVARGTLTASGVAIERHGAHEHGALRPTGRDLDFAIAGDGAFALRDGRGHTASTRDGSFVRERDGTLRDARGRTLLGTHGALVFPDGARIDERGNVILDGRKIDRITIPAASTLHSGYLEAPAVDAIREMIDVLCAERSFESAEKVVSAIDRVREKSSGEVARVK